MTAVATPTPSTLSAAEQWVLDHLEVGGDAAVLFEHLLWSAESAGPLLTGAFGPNPRRRSLSEALGNLYDHHVISNSPAGWYRLGDDAP